MVSLILSVWVSVLTLSERFLAAPTSDLHSVSAVSLRLLVYESGMKITYLT